MSRSWGITETLQNESVWWGTEQQREADLYVIEYYSGQTRTGFQSQMINGVLSLQESLNEFSNIVLESVTGVKKMHQEFATLLPEAVIQIVDLADTKVTLSKDVL